MKSLFSILVISLFAVSLLAVSAVDARATDSIAVSDATICRDVVNRTPIDPDVNYSAAIGKIYCFTKITGAQDPTQISHVWYFGDVERAQVSLPVGSANWRTWSSKTIQPNEVGQWFVDVVDANGKVLQTLQFKITP
jgi:hypothetical protein